MFRIPFFPRTSFNLRTKTVDNITDTNSFDIKHFPNLNPHSTQPILSTLCSTELASLCLYPLAPFKLQIHIDENFSKSLCK